MEKLLLKPAEAAETLGLGRSKIYELIRDGALPAIRVGGLLRVPAGRLRVWVESQTDASGGDRG